MRLGFACDWSQPRHLTWSGTPLALLEALQRALPNNVVDLDLRLTAVQRLAFKVANLSRHPATKAIQSEAAHSPRRIRAVARKFKSRMRSSAQLDAVLSLSDIAPTDNTPQYLYFDLSVAAFRQVLSTPELAALESVWYREDYLMERERQQREVYSSAGGLFAMSRFAAAQTAQAYNLPDAKFHVVGAGARVLPRAGAERLHDKEYLLFVGKDFERKGGPQLLQAYAQSGLRDRVDLVVAGPTIEKIQSYGIDGVCAVGPQSTAQLQAYFAHALAFVMPSHFEAYGLVFAEALAHGLPVIARDCCAMPEMVKHEHNGLLLPARARDAESLALMLLRIVDDERLRRTARETVDQVLRYYSWDRVARDIVRVISDDIQREA